MYYNELACVVRLELSVQVALQTSSSCTYPGLSPGESDFAFYVSLELIRLLRLTFAVLLRGLSHNKRRRAYAGLRHLPEGKYLCKAGNSASVCSYCFLVFTRPFSACHCNSVFTSRFQFRPVCILFDPVC